MKRIIANLPTTKKQQALSYFTKASTAFLKGLDSLGVDINDPNFTETAERVAKANLEILDGCINTDEQINKILSKTFPATNFNEIVIAQNITTFGICPHHLLPVEYITTVGYIPGKDGQVLGISKIASSKKKVFEV